MTRDPPGPLLVSKNMSPCIPRLFSLSLCIFAPRSLTAPLFILVVGSILCNLCKPLSTQRLTLYGPRYLPVVLVPGMCFFAGGIRFSEQGFGISARSTHAFYCQPDSGIASFMSDDRFH
jgi:hypothetical protein